MTFQQRHRLVMAWWGVVLTALASGFWGSVGYGIWRAWRG